MKTSFSLVIELSLLWGAIIPAVATDYYARGTNNPTVYYDAKTGGNILTTTPGEDDNVYAIGSGNWIRVGSVTTWVPVTTAQNSGEIIVVANTSFTNLTLDGGVLHNGLNSSSLTIDGTITVKGTSSIDVNDTSGRAFTFSKTNTWTSNNTVDTPVKFDINGVSTSGTTVNMNNDVSGFAGGTVALKTVYVLMDANAGFTGGEAVNWNLTAARILTNSEGTYKLGALSSTTADSEIRMGNSKTGTFEIGALNLDTVYAGKISDSGTTTSIEKVGTGTLELTGTLSYAGTTTVTGGTLKLSGDANLETSSSITNNGTLEFAHTGDITLSKALAGTGALVKSGTGTLELSGALSGYKGSISITDGTLKYTSNSAFLSSSGSGTVTVNNDGILIFDTITSERYVYPVLAGTGSIIVNGTLNLRNANTFTGDLTVNKGVVYLGSDKNTLTQGDVYLNSTADSKAELRLHNYTAYGNADKTVYIQGEGVGAAGVLSGNNANSTLLNKVHLQASATIGAFSGNALKLSGVISGETGANLTIVGPGATAINAVATYSGTTTIASGSTTSLGVADAIKSSSAVSVSGILSYGTNAQTLHNLSGNGTVTGSANLTLSNEDTSKYTGLFTNVTNIVKTGNGTLQLNPGGTNTGTYTLDLSVNEGRLDYFGILAGDLTLSGTGVFSPGNSIGSATVNSAVLSDSGVILIEMEGDLIDTLTFADNDTTTILGTGSILIDFLGGEENLLDSFLFGNFAFSEDIGTDYNKLLAAGSSTGINLLYSDGVLSARAGANPVPEPSSFLLLILGAFGLLWLKQRKQYTVST